jgi:subfamily B ATP-binding cassette protein MsbA
MNEFKRLLRYVRPYWVTFVFALITMVLTAVFETATGALLVPIFSQFSLGSQTSPTLFNLQALIPQDDWIRAWTAISVLLVVFTICKGISEFFSSYLMAKIGQASVLKLRVELYDHLLKQSASFFERHRTNFLVSRLVVSSSAIEQAVSGISAMCFARALCWSRSSRQRSITIGG